MGEPLRLYGLRALVMSGASGIGEAVARTLAKHGANVLAVDGVNSGVEQQFESVKGVQGHVANLLDATNMPALVKDAVGVLGSIDILVNDFPLQPRTPLADADPALDDLLATRAGLVTSICRSALPHMKKSPAGRIVNIGFSRSVFAEEGGQAYGHAEQQLAALTSELAAETGEFGINVNYVQPGAIMTPASREIFRKNKALRDFCIAGSAARRLGEPIDVAKVVLFVVSDDAVFVNGTGIRVDGGRSKP
jgi:NAD(P)-dependent dehydrogenase (short-subunit alcohol dehydrogenase family)